MDGIEAQFDAFADTFAILDLMGLLFIIIVVSETLWDFLSGTRKTLAESMSNFAISLGNILLERTAYGLVFIIGLIIAMPFAVTSLPINPLTWVLAIIVADFSYYWMHRWEHEVRILWAYHSVHHSSPEFNLTTALRLAWIEGLIEWIFFVPMILVGFDLVQTIIALSAVVIYQTWIHTEKIGKLGWLEGVFNTPSVHRVHHGSNQKYLDKNYGGLLMIWDRLFGTFQAEEEPVIYGLTKPIETANPIKVNFYEYGQIIKDLKGCKSARKMAGVLFKPPGWTPSD